VTFHRGKRATDNVSTDSHDKKLTVRLNQCRNSPERDDREHQQKPAAKSELTGEWPFAQKDHCYSDGQQRDPSDWSLGKKSERQGQIENPPPMRCLMFDV